MSDKIIPPKKELLRDINNVKKRIDNYDWDYRIERFENKLEKEKEILAKVLMQIKLSE